jgi:tripeptidyl-peptidase-2
VVEVTVACAREATAARRSAYARRVALETTAPWIQAPGHMTLEHGWQRFSVRVDPTGLPEDAVHYGEVRAFDAADRSQGPLFTLPVTVVRPLAPAASFAAVCTCDPGTVHRHFLQVPEGATWADVQVKAHAQAASRVVALQAIQLVPGRPFAERRFEDTVRLEPGEACVRTIAVEGGRTLEVCLAQYWSSLGCACYDLDVAFHGLVPEPRVVRVDEGLGVAPLWVRAALGRERLGPEGSFTRLSRRVAPSGFEARALTSVRDAWGDGRVPHEAVLTYEFQIAEKADVRPETFLGMADEMEEAWSSALWGLFDAHRAKVADGPLQSGQHLSLEPGRYVLRLHLRHEDPERLEAVRQAPLRLEFRLSSPLSVTMHPTLEAALRRTEAFGTRDLEAGGAAAVFLASPPASAFPGWAEGGDELTGTFTLGSDDARVVGEGRRPGGWPISTRVPPKAGAEPRAEADDAAPATLEEELLGARVARLRALRERGERQEFEALLADVLKSRPGHLPALLEAVREADGSGPPEREGAEASAHADRVAKAAGRLVKSLDLIAIAAHFGAPDPGAGASRGEEREALREALWRKARALAAAGRTDAFLETLGRLGRWVDLGEGRYLALRVRGAIAKRRLGEALQDVDRGLDRSPRDRELLDLRLGLLHAVGADALAAWERAWMRRRFPASYPPF